jgi:quercetin dioxygenase-like cupin family protein
MSVSETFKQREGQFDIDLQIAHRFLPGTYAKEMTIPAGGAVGTHSHKTAHKSAYFGGPVLLKTDAGKEMLPFPAGVVDIPAGLHHEIHAIGETVWFCIWETDETDPELIDQAVKG